MTQPLTFEQWWETFDSAGLPPAVKVVANHAYTAGQRHGHAPDNRRPNCHCLPAEHEARCPYADE